MSTPYSERAQGIFLDTLELPPTQRADYLAAICKGDQHLRSEVEALLADDNSVGNYMAETLSPRRGDATLPPGEILSGRFKICRFISAGGMGAVYEAEDLVLRERMALKTIRSDIAATGVTLERFKREIFLARKVTHVNVCRIFDFEQHRDPERGDLVFLTMELLKGETLAKRIRSSGRVTTEAALPIVSQMASALAAAHQAHIIHRDFKSANVMLVGSGESTRAVVTDFGLARGNHPDGSSLTALSRTGTIAGTPSYMAPEQVEGGPITPAADIYALGVVMYEMVTGTCPFIGENALAVATRRLTERAPSPRSHVPALDSRWEKAILRCLERSPEDRFASALDIVHFLKGEEVAPAPREKRRRLIIVAALLALLIAAISAGVFISKARKPHAPAVAVLGFQNIASLPEAAWVSTGLEEGLRSQLAAAGKIRTLSGEEIAAIKKDLRITEFGSLAKPTLIRLHQLGADVVIVGSYTDLGKSSGGKIHLDISIQDASLGETTDALSADGSEKELAELVSQTGARLRSKFGLRELSSQEEAQLAIAQPNPEAAPLYSEGLNKLRSYDLSSARDLFQKAATADPRYPFAHAALSETWSMLGYDGHAKQEAKQAFDLSSKLPLEDRLSIEGRYYEILPDWNNAIQTYTELYRHFPDDLDYGLRLARAQTSAGKVSDALATLAALRKLPPPQGTDPRIDLQKAETAVAMGDYKTGEIAAASAIATSESRGAKVLQLRALNWACPVARHLGEMEKATSLCEQARRLGSAVGDQLGVARALNGLANIDNDQGNLKEALDRFEETFRITSGIGDQRDMSGALNNVAMVLASLGRFQEARQKYAQVLSIQREIGFTSEIPKTLSNLGDVLQQEGNLQAARALYSQSIAAARQSQSRDALALALSGAAAVSFEQGDLAGADRQYGEALSVQKSMGDKQDIAATLQGMADVDIARNNLSAAQAKYNQALALQRQVGDSSGAALSQVGLAVLLLEQNKNLAEAKGKLSAAAAEFQREKDTVNEARARALLARCLADGNDPAAPTEIRSAERLIEQGAAKNVRYQVLLVAARIQAAGGSNARAEALQKLKIVRQQTRESGMFNCELEARLAIARIELAQGRRPLARADLDALKKDARARGFGLIVQKAGQIA